MKLEDRYRELVPDRDPYFRRAQACSALTVASVCPPDGQSPSQVLPQTYSSFGARGATTVASKLMMAFMPPGDSAFNLEASTAVLMQEGVLSPPPDIIKGLAQCEQLINAKIEALNWRRQTYLSLLNLVIAGNVGEYIAPDGRLKLYPLSQFVCVRDFNGKVVEAVTAEKLKVRSLPDDLRARTRKKENEDVTLYSRFELVSEKVYAIQQDLDDVTVTAYRQHNGIMPFNAIAWELVSGENYGRSHVELNYSDLMALEKTSQQILECGAIAARNLIFVAPNAAGGNLRKRIMQARNGDVIAARGGQQGDVQAFQFNNQAAIQALAEEKATLKQDLSVAFLLTNDLRRDAERVTAYELQMLVSEIEQGMGGVYSYLGPEMVGWRMSKLIAQMQSKKELPDIGDHTQITVTTGLAALGKDAKLKKVQSFLALLANTPQAYQEEAAMYVKFDTILTPAAAALGFPESIKTSQEVQQEQQQKQQAQMQADMASRAAGPVAGAMAQQANPAQ
ncbi:portal protein [Caballeronia sp. LZ032]|uniref:portal protein n=1 Tax=Caballeronia sp. LZ032 TaxID=3038565 RepID=UPI00286C5751|nr:portal protein [Caballeronia sp. LZ032]